METLKTPKSWSEIEQQLVNLKAVEGGFSQAQRGLVTLDDGTEVFVKVGSDELTKKWAKKEIAVYRFLEKHSYAHSPRLIAANDDQSAFALEAFTPSNGWDWRGNWDDRRLRTTLTAMDDLASIPLDDTERIFFAGKDVFQNDNGWQPLLNSREKQTLLVQKLQNAGAGDIADQLDFPAETERSKHYVFSDDALVHYDLRADNCAWNKDTGQVRVIDWNWAELGDRDLDLAATLTSVQKSGYDLPTDVLYRLEPSALHWIAGFWFNAATEPIWKDGPETLRDFQLLSGVTALRLEQQRKELT